MNPRIKQVVPVTGYKLDLTFDNGERRLFDCSTHLQYECMTALKDIAYFNKTLIRYGTVGWPNGEDLCSDELYECSTPWNLEHGCCTAN